MAAERSQVVRQAGALASPAARFLVVLGILAAGCGSQPPAPEAAGPSLRAEFLKRHQLQGKVALVEFGLVTCVLSDSGLDEMMRLHKEDEIPGLAYVRVESTSDRKAIDEYFAAKSVAFPVQFDLDTSLSRAFDATIFPSFLLIDKFGHVRYRGPLPEVPKIIDWAETLLAEKDDPGPQAPMFGVSAVAVQKLLDETRLPDLQGAVKPLRGYIGQGGLVAVFVDTECPFSGEAITDMSKVASTLAEHKVPCLLVNLAEAKEKVEAFYAARKTGTPVLYDVTTATQKNWKVDGVPTVVLFDAGGTVVYRGKAVWASLAAAAETALKLPAGSIDFGVKGTEYG